MLKRLKHNQCANLMNKIHQNAINSLTIEHNKIIRSCTLCPKIVFRTEIMATFAYCIHCFAN